MIYFSEIKGKTVYTQDKKILGVLDDLIFKATEQSNITKFVVKNKKTRQAYIIPSEYIIKNLTSPQTTDFTVKKDFPTVETEANELSLIRNLLDKQIIDLVGNKIVRVNNVAIQDKNDWHIAGVDTGLVGILRWFVHENFINKIHAFFHLKPSTKLLSWLDIQPLELARGVVVLKRTENKLKKIRPEDLADHLEKTNIVNARNLIKMLDDTQAASVIENLNVTFQTALFQHFKPDIASKWITLIEPDEAVDILLTLSKRKQAEIMSFLPPAKQDELTNLIQLSYASSIGELITSKYVTVNSTDLIKDVLAKIRRETGEYASLNYIYVLNEGKQLVGVFSLHELILQPEDMPVYKFMTQNLVVIHLNTTKEIAIKKMLKYKIDALPVVNNQKHILGVVVIDDLADELLHKI